MEVIKKVIRLRGYEKTKITKALNNVEYSPDDVEIDVQSSRTLVENYLLKVAEFDDKIVNLYSTMEESPELNEEISLELEAQTNYAQATRSRLALLTAVVPVPPQNVVHAPPLAKPKLPELKIDVFVGEGVCYSEFNAFLTKFNNLVGLRTDISDSTKFSYL